MLKAVLLVLVMAGSALAECPPMEDLPIMYDDDTFMCAYFWQEKGADNPIQACNGNGPCLPENSVLSNYDGYEFSANEVTSTPIGSLIVLPGCTFYAFSYHNYGGSVDEYYSGIIPNFSGTSEMFDENCPNGIDSLKCRCQQKMIDCQPDDEFSLILSCDNTGSAVTTNCEYSKTTGTSYGQSETESMSVSESVSEEIQAGFRESYSQFGFSTTTGYDWSTTDESTFEESETVKISVDVDPGLLMTIQQAVGHCGDNDSRANFYNIQTSDGQGRTVSRGYYTIARDGSLKEVASNPKNSRMSAFEDKEAKIALD